MWNFESRSWIRPSSPSRILEGNNRIKLGLDYFADGRWRLVRFVDCEHRPVASVRQKEDENLAKGPTLSPDDMKAWAERVREERTTCFRFRRESAPSEMSWTISCFCGLAEGDIAIVTGGIRSSSIPAPRTHCFRVGVSTEVVRSMKVVRETAPLWL